LRNRDPIRWWISLSRNVKILEKHLPLATLRGLCEASRMQPATIFCFEESHPIPEVFTTPTGTMMLHTVVTI
jgi:hypothetical protein